jgi:hypothetical protein
VPFTVTLEYAITNIHINQERVKLNVTHQLLFQSDINFIRQKHECFLVTNKEAGLDLNDGNLSVCSCNMNRMQDKTAT